MDDAMSNEPLTEDEMREACRVSDEEVETCAHVLAHAQEDTIKDFRECGLIGRNDSLHIDFGMVHMFSNSEYKAKWQILYGPADRPCHSEFGLTLKEAVTRMKWWLECNGPKHS